MDLFDKILEEDEFVQRQRERGRQEGRLEISKEVLVNYISIRYPALTELARQRAEKTAQRVIVQDMLNQIFAASDEVTVRAILSSPISAA